MKKCSNKKCKHEGKLQSLDNFYKNDRTADGLRCYCKTCDNQRSDKWYQKKSEPWIHIIIGGPRYE